MNPAARSHERPSAPKRGPWRVAAALAIAAVLALGFWGYTQPGMALNWETLAALCGF